ncbi:MAG: hypothetical protein GY698_04660 [Actinomycetia bacterium]|nr:hypothetical protein [Actinomycetes bacterium]
MVFAALPWAAGMSQNASAAVFCGRLVLFLRDRRPNRLTTPIIPAALEFAFICAIYSIWRLTRMLPIVHEIGALDRARDPAGAGTIPQRATGY